jgi:hypothetical protein
MHIKKTTMQVLIYFVKFIKEQQVALKRYYSQPIRCQLQQIRQIHQCQYLMGFNQAIQ